MTVRENLNHVLEKLPDDRLSELLAFAEFLASRTDQLEWQALGRSQLAKAYGPAEPEYTLADVKSRGRQ
jgi:hypothetical protein